jgi:hypothetical protein
MIVLFELFIFFTAEFVYNFVKNRGKIKFLGITRKFSLYLFVSVYQNFSKGFYMLSYSNRILLRILLIYFGCSQYLTKNKPNLIKVTRTKQTIRAQKLVKFGVLKFLTNFVAFDTFLKMWRKFNDIIPPRKF